MDEFLYPKHEGNWDNILFREVLLAKIKPDNRWLDYGAGRGALTQMNFKGLVDHIAGIDPEPAVFKNPFLDEAKILDLADCKIPFEDNSFDLVFSDNVMEHVENPEIVFPEIHRVLKPGGLFISKTPNKNHYMPLIARTTPLWFHKFYNNLRGRDSIDTFPTVYKCNSLSQIKKLAGVSNFEIQQFEVIEGRPEYLRLTAISYLAGYIYERIVNSSTLFEPLRCVIVFTLKKV
ncbi:MAG: class I SAM-dependent methyltransferase [Rhizobiaceae bacterium]